MIHPCPSWYQDAKFGLFFHWGPYCVPAYRNEWYSRNMYATHTEQSRYHVAHYGPLSRFGYKDFIPLFTGEAFDPDAWADLAILSSARYAGPVSEHADNYSLWDSLVNPVNSVRTGPHRDVVGECFKAFRARGLRTLATFHHQWLWGWFMSTDPEADVYDPANEVYYGPALPLETNRYAPYRLPDASFCTMWRDKILEVVNGYAPDVMYFDSRANIIPASYKEEVIQQYYDRVPSGILTYKQEDFPAEAGVLDLECGRFAESTGHPWQTDDRLEDQVTWCITQNPTYKKASRVLQQLADVVSKNGNLLLNVGPQADGSFHPDAVRELTQIGNWLRDWGEAIYDTRPYRCFGEGPTQILESDFNQKKINEQLQTGVAKEETIGEMTSRDIRYTYKAPYLYAIVMRWPEDGRVRLQVPVREAFSIRSISLLKDSVPLAYHLYPEYVEVVLPSDFPATEDPIVLKISGQ